MFENYTNNSSSIQSASLVLVDIRSIYIDAKRMQQKLALYQSGTDLVFNATINALFTPQERTELSSMLAEVNALVTDWETNHKNAIGITTP